MFGGDVSSQSCRREKLTLDPFQPFRRPRGKAVGGLAHDTFSTASLSRIPFPAWVQQYSCVFRRSRQSGYHGHLIFSEVRRILLDYSVADSHDS